MKNVLLFFIFLNLANAGIGQKTVPIWSDKAPGSEAWKWAEQEDSLSVSGDPLAYNIVNPTLTYYPADPSIANGTSVIICPGGSFCYLHIRTEGTEVARWLNKKGVSAFLLKYRVLHSETSHPKKEKTEKKMDTANVKRLTSVVYLAIADGKQAIAFVRKHAAEYGLAPDRIGIMGFSAGGTLASASAFDYTSENRPDFVAPIYAYVPPALPMIIQKDAPPLFVVAATDDELHLTSMSLDLYSKWLTAGHSAEMHIYSKGGHGFGMNKKNLPSDSWIERFGDWLQVQGLQTK